MSESAQPQGDFALEDSVSLESILCTEELRCRPQRPPDYEKENRALVALAKALVDSKSDILQILAETILEVTQCDSSGLSLLTTDDGGKRFYWPAIAGAWKPHTGGGTPRKCGPCGDVLDHDSALLFQHFERRYTAFLPVMPAAEESLIVPFYVDGTAVGTMWAIMHSDRRKFDAEDERIMTALGRFASVAHQTLASLHDLKIQVAAREKAESALRELANGLKVRIGRLVDANIMGILFWDLEGKITEANEEFLNIVQYSREDLVSGNVRWTDMTPADWRARDERARADLQATGAVQPYEKEFFRKDRTRVPVLVGSALFEDSGNQGVAFVLDLSEQKHAEETLRQAQEDLRNTQAELAHMNRVMTIGELAASIAHEVNQPLAAIIASGDSCTAWLANEPPNVDKARVAANRIIQAATQASDSVQRIRALFKKTTSMTSSVDLNAVIKDTLSLVHHETQRHNISLQTELDAALPSVSGDRVQLQQVILNLVINGIESVACPGHEPRQLMIRSALSSPGELLVSVEDSGPGIDAEYADRVFAPFFTTKPQGIGMGLPICRSIVEAHGGRLWAAKNEPHGAVFHFILPTKHQENE